MGYFFLVNMVHGVILLRVHLFGSPIYLARTNVLFDRYIHNQDSRFKILYSHKPMHYNGTEINTNIQYQYLRAHDNLMLAGIRTADLSPVLTNLFDEADFPFEHLFIRMVSIN